MEAAVLDQMSKEQLVEALQTAEAEARRNAADPETERVLHDLRIHQFELEMQNRELRDAHAQLEESQSRYADLYDFAPVAYCTLDKDGRLLAVNLTLTAYLGIDRGELIGTPLAALAVADDRPLLRNHVRRCIKDEERVTTELRFLVGELGPIDFQLVSTPLRRLDGGVIGCKTALTDVSALKRSEERLRLLSEVSATLGRSFDVAHNLGEVTRSLAPAFADLAFADLLGSNGELQRVEVAIASPEHRAVAEALRRSKAPWSELKQPLLASEGAADALSQVVASGPERTALLDALRPTSVILAPMLARERPVGLVGLVTTRPGRRYLASDVAFAKDLAARAAMAVDNSRLYEEARAATQARQDILSIVSHELKNSLTAINLSAEMMLKASPSKERRRGRHHLERVKRGAQHMRNMIEDLLDMSSLESGHLSIAPSANDMATAIDEAIDLLLPLANEKHISLEREPGARLGAFCDKGRVLQVLSNLLGNAIKFNPEHGRVVVKAELLADEQRVRVTVQDNGPGVPKQVMLRLFERYWQATETASKGRGLGLFIAKGVIEAQGGTIWVESQPHKGTAFSFTLPAAELKQPPERLRGALVMVVDDDEDIRELVAEVLEEASYAVVKASTGEQALKYLQSGEPRPQLVLLDLIMPVMDGRELMAALKQDPALSELPVVMVSSVPELAEEARVLGAAGSLRKPIDIDALLALVSERIPPERPDARA